MNKRFFTTEISDPRFEKDNLRFITVRSKNLPGRGDLTVYVPQVVDVQHVPIVILLHGVYGSAWCWPLKSGVHLIADNLVKEKRINPMILVMPSDGLYRDGSGYLHHTNGCDYEKWIVEDVLDVIRQEIIVASDQSPLFITGLSMGGYGALRMGAKYAHLFKAFSGLSSITEFRHLAYWYEYGNIEEISASVPEHPGVLETILLNKKNLPPFMFDCGDNDILIDANRTLHTELLKKNIAHAYHEYPGEHNWNYWSDHIKEHLLFFNKQL
ncbi:MAG: alpha/beta hydrolase-fold protein [Ginsengibacter sp.]